jgi:hypothetical protein
VPTVIIVPNPAVVAPLSAGTEVVEPKLEPKVATPPAPAAVPAAQRPC